MKFQRNVFSFSKLKKVVIAGLMLVLALTFVQTQPSFASLQSESVTSFDFANVAKTKLSSLENKSATVADSSATKITMHRLYNKYTGEHFYTADESEKTRLVTAGWTDEGTGWIAPTKSGTPVYRLYNPYVSGGDHHYTTDEKEYNDLGSQGWKQEGVGWYSVDEGESDRVPLYRQYNPYATTGTHNYTKDEKEKNELIKLGWRDEKIGWYGYESLTPAIDFSKINVSTTTKTYNGKALTQTITSAVYKENTHYTVTYSDNKNAGTAKITIKGTGKYTGSRTYNFKINKATLNVSWENVALTYNAKAQAPKATVTGVLGTDKVTTSVSGAKTNAGDNYTASATVNNSNYQLSGNTTKFSIAKAPLTLAWGDATFTYNAKAQKPTAIIASGLQDKDTVTVNVAGEQTSASDEAYTATATISNANYALTGETSKSFTIAKLDITNAEVQLGDALTYNADVQTQTVSKVYVGDAVLTEGVDFDVTGNTGNAAGTYTTLTVTGKTNCTGVKENVEFKIAKAPITVTWTNTAFTYDASSHKPDATFEGTQGEDTITLTVSGDQTNANAEGENYEATASLDDTSANNYEITEATKTVKFTIAKADPTYTPGTLKGILNEKLSTVNLPAPSATDTPGSVNWVDGTQVMDTLTTEEVPQIFEATFIPSDTINYNTVTIKVTVNVVQGLTAKFVANAPGGLTAKVDGQDTVEKTLTFDSGKTVHTLANADFPTSVKITSSSNPSGYFFCGWATSGASATYGTVKAQLVGTQISADTTYYAVWKTPSGYWLGTAGADANYATEEYFALNDPNYHSAAEIAADMTVLHNNAKENYSTVKSKWTSLYNNGDSGSGVGYKVRLYATYANGATTADYSGNVSTLNKYVEFRIIEVSSTVAGHDSDESAVTFMATHLLPKAYSMNGSNTNVGGWGSSSLKTAMNSDSGDIYKNFATDFKNQVKSVNKKYGTGNATTSTTSGSYKFWLLSASELTGTDYISEGSKYAWCTKNNITWGSTNNILANWKTRAGATPGSANDTNASWWERSPYTGISYFFLSVSSGGNVNHGDGASGAWGVAPAFCF